MAYFSWHWFYSRYLDWSLCSSLAELCIWFMHHAVLSYSVSTWFMSKFSNESVFPPDQLQQINQKNNFPARKWWWAASTNIPSVRKSIFLLHWICTWILSTFSLTFWPFCRRRGTKRQITAHNTDGHDTAVDQFNVFIELIENQVYAILFSIWMFKIIIRYILFSKFV